MAQGSSSHNFAQWLGQADVDHFKMHAACWNPNTYLAEDVENVYNKAIQCVVIFCLALCIFLIWS